MPKTIGIQKSFEPVIIDHAPLLKESMERYNGQIMQLQAMVDQILGDNSQAMFEEYLKDTIKEDLSFNELFGEVEQLRNLIDHQNSQKTKTPQNSGTPRKIEIRKFKRFVLPRDAHNRKTTDPPNLRSL